ncbi:MAG: YdgA family protein [Proteobacteria bacterium]|nr:YdgA family protein [Pseudomonadota bacterium]MCL2307420.1 YdgA family protein [Pseudomonadota bacterium]
MGATKKIISATALIAVVFIIGGSYWTGKGVEKTFRADVEEMAKYGIWIKQIDYRRGIFSATARTEWALSPERGSMIPGEESPTVSYKHRIWHGPLLSPRAAASIRSELVPPENPVAFLVAFFPISEESAAMLVDAFGSNPFGEKAPITIETTVGWDGGIRARIASPGMEFPVGKDQSRCSWGGLNGEISRDSARSKVKANIVMGGLSVVGSNENRFQTGQITFRSDVEQLAGYEFTPVGTSSVVLDRFWYRVSDKSNDTMSETVLENARIEFSATINNGIAEWKTRFDADKVTAKNGAITIEKPGVTLLLENIDAQAHEAIQKVAREQSGENMHHVFLREQAKLLLQRKPALTIKDLNARWPEGMMTGNLRIAYEGDGDITRFSPSDLAVDLQFSLPRALVIRLLEMQAAAGGDASETQRKTDTLHTMIKSGVLIEKDGILSISANHKDGTVILNGQSPQPFTTLLGLLGFW